jgi:hypothetical protein
MAITVTAVSLAIIALVCVGAAAIFFLTASSIHHPSFNELADRREAEMRVSDYNSTQDIVFELGESASPVRSVRAACAK